ncbi:DUF6114 domain-containing protein [Streptomyces sp. N2-109]|uniref:DUF6114 domain-containing protein n=1 Tax=Streptomyces gossypii TaxID=2883101 RepID=A0ABT2JX33_9ACTN|nr:DUF6114 domain-containing protein [Streptomyces gossypii]MCT2592470.1 DUF6114 domain-containing protein [Streptomyces gossypii]
MSADTRERPIDRLGRMRANFRVWRGQRPFWGGIFTLLAGIPIMYVPYQNLTLGSLTIRMSTTAGAGSLIIGVLLIVLGLTMWFQPQSRVFAGVAAILLALVSLVVSNFGAFLIGFVPGLLGGALGVSWAPGRPLPTESAVAGRGATRGERAKAAGLLEADDAANDDLSVTGTASAPASSASTAADGNHANGRHGAG